MSSRRDTLLTGVVAAGAAAATYAALTRLPAGLRAPWERTNHAGRTVTLLEGPAHALGLAAGAGPAGPAPVVAALGSAAFGALDDLRGDASSKGLRGHLRAAAQGRITTGLVKVGGLAVTGLAAAALLDRSATPASHERRATVTSTLVGGAVIAGTANLVNLLDLRPGRALKAGLLGAAPLVLGGPSRSRTAGAVIGASLGVIAPDLRGEAMLGDTGANALGAVLGTALIDGRGARTRLFALGVLTALTLASEKVSFTKVIESTPVLRELDQWGRPSR